MNQRVLIVGATSGMARAIADRFAAQGCELTLASRNVEEAGRIAADLRTRHQATAHVEPFDAMAMQGHGAFVARCIDRAGGALDGVVICHGYLPDQAAAQANADDAERTLRVNFNSAVSVVEPLAAHLAERGQGWIAIIGSVAGDRGRQSNYLYGAAKAGLAAYAQGLRNRLFHKGVHVLTVKPGFVATAMTEGLVDPKSPLVVGPEVVAKAVVKAVHKRRNVIYTPWFWRVIMGIIRSIPEMVFKRLRM